MRAVLPASDLADPRPRLGELSDPVPGPDEVLVAVRVAGLNCADLLQLRGLYPPPPGEIINELGLEPLGLMETEAVKKAVCARIGSW